MVRQLHSWLDILATPACKWLQNLKILQSRSPYKDAGVNVDEADRAVGSDSKDGAGDTSPRAFLTDIGSFAGCLCAAEDEATGAGERR
jgi:hypothetical protein